MSTTDTAEVTLDLESATPAEIRRFFRPEPEVRTVLRRSPDGTVEGAVELDPSLFGIEPNLAVLHQVVTAQLAAARSGTQSTKTRAEVRGGGAKPFRQKGTGRARQGSTRSPQWVGGGVALGPKPRGYGKKTTKKMIQLALRSALSDRASQGRVAVVTAWDFEIPSTKGAIAALEALGLSGRVLVVLGPEDGYVDRSFGNLPDVQTVVAGELNAYDILVNDWLVFTDETLPGASTRVDAPEVEDEVEDVVIEVEVEVEVVDEDEIEADAEAGDEADDQAGEAGEADEADEADVEDAEAADDTEGNDS